MMEHTKKMSGVNTINSAVGQVIEAQKQRELFFNPQGYMGKFLQKGRLNIGFIDGMWGSSGKGKFNALLAWDPELDFAVSHNSVNASHIVVWDDGREYKFQHLPTSVVNPKIKIVMGAGASIELPQLLKEIRDWSLDHTNPSVSSWADSMDFGGPGRSNQRLFIHPNAVVITQDDVDYEKEHLVRIASTMTGNGAAAGRKVMRHPSTRTTSDCPELQQYICDTSSLIARWIAEGQTGILETAQGFDLSMDHGMLFEHTIQTGPHASVHKAYPYCTSRNVDPLTFAGMTGIGLKSLGKVFLNLRALPIKVGDGSNTKVDGYSGVDMTGSNSGPCWPDQRELSWDGVTTMSGSNVKLIEQTSLTKRIRRVFTFSDMQLHHITKVVQPDFITINFVNYVDASIFGISGEFTRRELESCYPAVAALVRRVEQNQYFGGPVTGGIVVALGTGPANSHVIHLVGG